MSEMEEIFSASRDLTIFESGEEALADGVTIRRQDSPTSPWRTSGSTFGSGEHSDLPLCQ